MEWYPKSRGRVAGYEEYVHQNEASMERLMETVGALCPRRRGELNEAARGGTRPRSERYGSVEREVVRRVNGFRQPEGAMKGMERNGFSSKIGSFSRRSRSHRHRQSVAVPVLVGRLRGRHLLLF